MLQLSGKISPLLRQIDTPAAHYLAAAKGEWAFHNEMSRGVLYCNPPSRALVSLRKQGRIPGHGRRPVSQG